MGIISNLFSKDKELTEARAMITDLSKMVTDLSKEHVELSACVESLKDEVERLKKTNGRLVDCILRASDYDAMKAKVRLARFGLTSNPHHMLPPGRR